MDNPMVRAVLNVFIISTIPKLASVAMTPIERATSGVIWLLHWLVITQLFGGLRRIYFWLRQQPVQYTFTIRVAQMNADRQPSLLYDALLWYIMSRPKEEREAAQELEYFVPKQGTTVASALEANLRSGASAGQATASLDEMKRKLLSTIPQSQTSSFLWKDSGVRINFSFEKEEIEMPGEKGRKRENRKIVLWRASESKDLSEWFAPVFAEILKAYEDSKRSQVWKQETYVNRKDGQWEKLRNSNTRTLETTILKSKQKERIVNILSKFSDPEEIEFMTKVGRPNKLTFMLSGPPGCGKTTLQQAISSQLKRHLYYLNLSNVNSNEQLTQLFEKINNAESAVVMEEIDVATVEVLNREMRDAIRAEAKAKREEASSASSAQQSPYESVANAANASNSSLTLEGILNVLQGMVDADKRILFMTSNRPEVLDPAITRPGRVDCDLRLDNCDLFQIESLFHLYYEEQLNEEHLAVIREAFGTMASREGFVAPTPCQVDNLLVQFRDDIERGIEAFKQLLADPKQEIFVPAKNRKAPDSPRQFGLK
jgi:SpoVK/Ycf46/Vps4 family AAA+-type ATPase